MRFAVEHAVWDINDQGWLVVGYVQLNESDRPVSYGFLAKPVRPVPLVMRPSGNKLVLDWPGSMFNLQCAPGLGGVFTNILCATSPRTNLVEGGQRFYRLIAE